MNTEEKKAYCRSVAETIRIQLRWSITLPKLLSWGVSEYTACWHNGMASLRMKVNGMVHKGFVMVCYDEGPDEYILHLLDMNLKVVKTINNVYADELGALIDEEIEHPKTMTDAEYKAGIMKELLAG